MLDRPAQKELDQDLRHKIIRCSAGPFMSPVPEANRKCVNPATPINRRQVGQPPYEGRPNAQADYLKHDISNRSI